MVSCRLCVELVVPFDLLFVYSIYLRVLVFGLFMVGGARFGCFGGCLRRSGLRIALVYRFVCCVLCWVAGFTAGFRFGLVTSLI